MEAGTTGSAPDHPPARQLAQGVVEAALRKLAANSLSKKADSMLRTFLAYSAIPRVDGEGHPKPTIDIKDVRSVVQRLFTVYPTPDGAPDNSIAGTPTLRGTKGCTEVEWLSNESYRSSFVDYAGPSNEGRFLFTDEDWHKPLDPSALQTVQDARDGGTWPPRDVLAVIALSGEELDSTWGWQELMHEARSQFGLDVSTWEALTSDPILAALSPFGGPEWDPANLSEDLRPRGAPPRIAPGGSGGTSSSALVQEQTAAVVEALQLFGKKKFIALAGVPGTGKSHVAGLAAAAFASPNCVRRIQFSPGYPYEEFIEGPRFDDSGKVVVEPGVLLAINQEAIDNPTNRYVLLIEEFTRADLTRVLGELLTFVEYRDEDFFTMYTRQTPRRIASNLAFLVTYNPTDRSAIALDAALIRRLEIIDFPPRTDLLRDILESNKLPLAAIAQLELMFDNCREVAGDRFQEIMPFGHATFADVTSEADLHRIWEGQLRKILVRPNAPKHELHDVIRDAYPWLEGPGVEVVAPEPDPSTSAGAGAGGSTEAEPPDAANTGTDPAPPEAQPSGTAGAPEGTSPPPDAPPPE